MVNPNDNNKLKEAAREENLQDVTSEQEDMPITTSPVSSPSSSPVAADDQAGEKGTSSSTTPQKKPKKKCHLTIQREQEDTPPNTADYQGGKKVLSAKRGKRPAEGTSSSMPKGKKQQKKKGLDILGVVPSSPPRCYICQKLFKTWRAVFGHMRIHNKVEEVRENRAFPPPHFTPPDGASPEEEIDSNLEELAPVLLNIAQQVILESTRPDGLIIDLNQPCPSSPNQKESTRLFDLNEPPPPEEDEEKDHNDDQNIDGGSDDSAN